MEAWTRGAFVLFVFLVHWFYAEGKLALTSRRLSGLPWLASPPRPSLGRALGEAWQGSSEKGPFLPLAAGLGLEHADSSGLLSAPS